MFSAGEHWQKSAEARIMLNTGWEAAFEGIDHYDMEVAYVPTVIVQYLTQQSFAIDIEDPLTMCTVLRLIRKAFTPPNEATPPFCGVAKERFVCECANSLDVPSDRVLSSLEQMEALELIYSNNDWIMISAPTKWHVENSGGHITHYSAGQLHHVLG